MPKIKGPIKIKGGFKASDFLKENSSDLKIKLPFSATGFKSAKIPKHADMSGIEMAKEKKPKPVEKKKVVKKATKKAKK